MSAFALISSCHSDKWASSNVSAARQPVCVAAEHLAMVRCCTDRECISVCPLPKDQANAYGVKLPVAEALCLARGARLCTVAELAHKCCQKGCGYDYAFTWSSDPCSAPAAARVDPFLLQPSFAGSSSCQAGVGSDGGVSAGVPLLFIPQCSIDGVFSSLRPLLVRIAVLTRTSRSLNTVRTGYAYHPPACCTYRRRGAACPWAPRTVRAPARYVRRTRTRTSLGCTIRTAHRVTTGAYRRAAEVACTAAALQCRRANIALRLPARRVRAGRARGGPRRHVRSGASARVGGRYLRRARSAVCAD